MKTFFDFLDRLVETLGILVTCALIVIAFIQVFWRYVLATPFPGLKKQASCSFSG